MVTLISSTTSTMYQPGKAPLLLDDSPASLTAFTRAARLFFRSKKITEDEDKIAYVGAGLASFQDLYQWYLSAAEEHEAKAYDAFLLELQKRALPRDYIWEARGRIRTAKQGDRDFEDWLEDMRAEHLSLTEKILPTRDFVAPPTLRYGRRTLLVSTTAIVYPPLIDYLAFDREARDEWSKIAARRRSNAAQFRSLSKKTTNLSLSSSTRNSPALARPSSAKASSSNSATTDNGTAKNGGGRTRPNKLTELEKDWLSANQGCFRCRKANVDHRAEGCTDWPATDYVVPVPPGWSKDNAAATSTTTPRVGIAAVQGFDEEEIDLPESLAQDPDSDAYALPPLSLLVGSRQSGLLTDALADSGSFVSLIADKLASRLGLVRRRMGSPKTYRLAIEGGEESKTITEFVRVPLHLATGSWSAGPTTLLIAPLEEPFGIILGTPFLRQHKISISFDHDVQLLISQPAPLLPIDLYAEAKGPLTQRETLEELDDAERDEILDSAMETIIARVEARTDEEKEMAERAARVMANYDDLFPDVLPALTLDYLKRTATRHKIKFSDSGKTHNMRGFNVPRKWRERWKKMLDEHLASGRLRPSTSPFASAAFIIPKKDPMADPRWVNDYRVLNANTVKDRTPLPVPDVVLGDAALAKVWGKIDMTNAFFQTPMSDEDIAKTAIKTPWGLFEWTVMPQGLCNAPATHQARVNEALRHLIGVCCQAFVDDIIIYSSSLEEHEKNCRAVLDALRAAGLYCSRKKTDLSTLRTDFLGHIISREGLEADPSKVEKIKNWTTPTTVTQDSDEPIWLMTDASKVGIGAVLLQGKDWRTAVPCGFYSRQYIAAEKNYPTHEQELLCVVAAMKAWRLDLLGVKFQVLTDHDTLKHFKTQLTLSKRQARWTEVLADYDFEISYIPGPQNAVADALSRFSFGDNEGAVAVNGISAVSLSPSFVKNLGGSYADDPFCSPLLKNLASSPGFSRGAEGLLLFEDSRIVVPKVHERQALYLTFLAIPPRASGGEVADATSFHPETDGRSERTNKTAVQVLRQYVSRQQKDWEVIAERKSKIEEVRDALAASKVRQAEQANRRRGQDQGFKAGDLVMVDSADRRARYKTRGGNTRAAQLFPRWDGPYVVKTAFPDTSTYHLDLPSSDRSHPVFHSSKLKTYNHNDPLLHPNREPPQPEPMNVEGEKEYVVEAILDEKGKGRGRKYLVRWEGYPDSDNTWEAAANVEDTEALDIWEGRKGRGEV
ncbi:hypothetical protein JCM11641_005468 [Rhodosporidiobolus odoratus]